MKAVFKREFSSAFHRPTLYVALFLQLLVSAIVISANNLTFNLESISTAVSFMSLISLLLIPAIAGEFIPFGKRAGVDKVYGSLPILDRHIALGKLLAAVSAVLIGDAFLIISPFLAGFFGTVDHLMSYTALLGLILFQAVAVAFSLLVHNTIRNRIVSYVTIYSTAVLLILISVFILYFPVSSLLSFICLCALCLILGIAAALLTKRAWIGVVTATALAAVNTLAFVFASERFAGLFITVITALSPIDRFDSFIWGVLKFSSVLYFLSLGLLLIWCFCRSFALRHEPHQKRPSINLKKLSSSAFVLLLAASLLCVNVAASAVPQRFSSVDATLTHKATPSDNTLSFLSTIDKDVDFYLLEPVDINLNNAMNNSVFRLYLEKLVASNPHFSLTCVYGDEDPGFYSERGLSMNDILPNSLIIQSGDRWEYVNYYSLLCFANSDFGSSYMDISEYEYMVTMVYNMYMSNSEYAQYWYSINYNTTLYRYADTLLAFVVEYVTKDIIPTSYYLTGHGEADMNEATSVFYNLGLTPLDTTNTDIPRDASGIVVNMPSEDFSVSERDAFLDYLAGGGQMTFFTNKENLDMPNLMSVLSAYGMSVEDTSYVTRDIEVEGENEDETVYEPTSEILLSVNYNSDVLGTIDSTTASSIALTDANAITVNTDGLEYPNVISLFESPSDCYLGDDKDSKASYILSCAVETPDGARVVWFTGGESMTNTATGTNSIIDAAISWVTLVYETGTGNITPTLYQQPPAIISSGGSTAVSVLLYITSVGFLVYGIVDLYRRKKAR